MELRVFGICEHEEEVFVGLKGANELDDSRDVG
jgi:hypothetical protein